MFTEKQIKQLTRNQLAMRFDASETAFLERELTQIRARVFEVQYAELLARNFMPFANDIASSAETYTYFVYDRKGRAKVIANGTKDLPRVDIVKSEVTGKVREIGDSYGWNITEMREAARVGTPLGDMKARAARRAIETTIDQMLATGTDDTGLDFGVTGMINNGDVDDNIIAPANDPWTDDSDPADILADMNNMVATIVNGTNQRWIPDTMLFAPREFQIIAQKRVSALESKTILRSFLENNPYIRNIDQWWRLTDAAANGTDNRAICYKRDPEVLEGVVPLDFEQIPPQPEGLEFIVPCHARCGGVKVYHPEAMVYADFVQP